MKKLVIIVVALILLTSVGYAAPLMDYSFGRVTLDLGFNASPTQTPVSLNGYSTIGYTITTGYNFDFGATAGLGGNFAFNYSQQNMSGSQQTYSDVYGSGSNTPTMQVQQLNLLYNFAPVTAPYNLSGFVGVQYGILGKVYFVQDYLNQKSTWQDSKNLWGGQIGVRATAHVADSVIVFGQAQYGWPYYQLGGGVAYVLSPSFDVNLSANYISTSLSIFEDLRNKPDANEFSIPITLGLTWKI